MTDIVGGGPPPGCVAGDTRRRHAATLIVAAGLFMESLDATIIANALPHMARSFGVLPLTLNIGITAYMIAVGAFIPVSGWLSGRFGARATFATAVAGFTLASLGCAASTSLPVFVAARVVQGIAAAMMTRSVG